MSMASSSFSSTVTDFSFLGAGRSLSLPSVSAFVRLEPDLLFPRLEAGFGLGGAWIVALDEGLKASPVVVVSEFAATAMA